MKGILIVALVCSVSVVHSTTLSKVPVAAQKNWEIIPKLGDIWTDCSNNSNAKILSVKISPDPPKEDATVTIDASVNLLKEVTGGSIKIDVKAGIIPVTDTVDLCDLAKEAGLPCPISTGVKNVTVSEEIPNLHISAHITGNVHVTNQDGAELACIKLDFELKKASIN